MKLLAHISDIHFGRVDPAIAEALVGDLHEHKPDVVVASGDFTQRARVGQYREAAAFLERLPKPQVVVPGNHDIPLWNFVRRFASPLGRYKRFISSELCSVYRDEEIVVVGVNTARPFTFSWNGFWKDGRIGEKELGEIEAALKGEPPMRVVVTHHPFVPPPEEKEMVVHGAAEALRRLEAVGVDLLLAGHLHQGYSADVRTHYEGVKRSMLSVQASTAASTRLRGQPNAYNLIRVETGDEAEIAIEVRAWVDGRFSLTETARYRRREGVWQKQ